MISASPTGYFYNNVHTAKSVSKSVKPERYTMIPPHSLIENNHCRLVRQVDALPKTTAIYTATNTPLHFRNYLTISTNENFEGKVSVIDNSFFVSDVKKVIFPEARKYKKHNSFYTCKKVIDDYSIFSPKYGKTQ